jgi:hypothetical protein
MTQQEYWVQEAERLDRKYVETKEYGDKVQAAAARIMAEPTHAGGYDLAFDRAINNTPVQDKVTNAG